MCINCLPVLELHQSMNVEHMKNEHDKNEPKKERRKTNERAQRNEGR